MTPRQGLHTRHAVSSLMLGVALLVLTAEPARAQAANVLTWNEAIHQALSANQSLAAAQEALDAKKEDVAIVKANFLPSIDVAGSFSASKTATFSQQSGVIPERSFLVGASLHQMIYDETVFAGHDVEKDLFASQEAQLQNTQFAIVAEAGQAYLGLRLAEDLLQVQIDNIGLTQENLRITEIQEQIGETSYQEVLRWRSQLYADQQQLVDQRSNVLVNRFALNQVVARPVEDTYTVEKVTVQKNGFIFSSEVVDEALSDEDKARTVGDFLVELGLSSSPALRSLDREIDAQMRQLESDRRWLIPSAELTAGADEFVATSGDGSDSTQTDKGFWKLGASLNWNVFGGGANRAVARQASSELTSLRFQQKQLQSALEQSIRASVAVAVAAYQNIALASSQADTAGQNFRLVSVSYLEGESSILDLLDAQEQKLGADSAVVAALYTFLADLLFAEQAMGYFPFLEPPDQVEARVRELENRLRGQR